MPWPENDHRAIVHLNVADFAVAVERLVDRRLRNRPVLVALECGSRSAVYDMSEEAFQAGIRKGMPLRRARKICPDARVVPPHADRYERAMAAVWKRVCPYSPLVETGEGNGHLFADLTGTSRLFGPPPDVALRLRRTIRADLGLDPIWSLAPNKLVAKVATRVVKPDGEYIVPAGDEQRFLNPLPPHLLPGLEKDDLVLLREFHLTRVGDAALWTPRQLHVVFGRRGRDLHRIFRGIDRAPVLPAGRKPPSVVRDHEFGEDTNDPAVVASALYALAEKAGAELRERSRAARRLALILDYSDGVRVARQKSCRGTAVDFRLFDLARQVLGLAWRRRVRLRRLRLVCDRLAHPPAQLELFPDQPDAAPPDRLQPALDRIRNRFGRDIIQMGRARAAA